MPPFDFPSILARGKQKYSTARGKDKEKDVPPGSPDSFFSPPLPPANPPIQTLPPPSVAFPYTNTRFPWPLGPQNQKPPKAAAVAAAAATSSQQQQQPPPVISPPIQLTPSTPGSRANSAKSTAPLAIPAQGGGLQLDLDLGFSGDNLFDGIFDKRRSGVASTKSALPSGQHVRRHI